MSKSKSSTLVSGEIDSRRVEISPSPVVVAIEPASVPTDIPTRSIAIPIPLGMAPQNQAFLRRAFLRLAELFMEGEKARAEGELLISVKMTNGLCGGKLRKRAEWTEELRRGE